MAAPIVHAWQAGPQTTQLRDFLATMSPTGTFVMTIPKAPYRCPPGPYERACVVADSSSETSPAPTSTCWTRTLTSWRRRNFR